MCGRYTFTPSPGFGIPERFGVASDPPIETLERYNVCPNEQIAIVNEKEGERRIIAGRWGLVPTWAKALGQGREPINARSETVASKKPFSELYARPERRCLVLADGWYEWLRSENPKQPRIPFRYTVDEGDMFAFAGLFGYAKIGEEWVTSATILTTTANEVCAPVHDRKRTRSSSCCEERVEQAPAQVHPLRQVLRGDRDVRLGVEAHRDGVRVALVVQRPLAHDPRRDLGVELDRPRAVVRAERLRADGVAGDLDGPGGKRERVRVPLV